MKINSIGYAQKTKKSENGERESLYDRRLGTKKSQDDGDMFFFHTLFILIQWNAMVRDPRGEYNNDKDKREQKGDIYNEVG